MLYSVCELSSKVKVCKRTKDCQIFKKIIIITIKNLTRFLIDKVLYYFSLEENNNFLGGIIKNVIYKYYNFQYSIYVKKSISIALLSFIYNFRKIAMDN